MPLLKSLLCLKGLDNGRRYLSVSLFCYLLFILLSSVLAKAFILMLLLLSITLPILTATSIRRINDARVPKSFAVASPLVYCLCVFVITYINHDATWFLLIVAALVTLAMSFLNHANVKRNHQYILGYFGPVDLSAKSNQFNQYHSYHQRIEPTLVAKGTHQSTTGEQQTELNSADSLVFPEISRGDNTLGTNTPASHYSMSYAVGNHSSPINFNWSQQFSDWFAVNRRIKILSLIALVTLLVLSIFIIQLFQAPPTPQNQVDPVDAEPAKVRLNKLEMPDNFWVMHDENDAITIGWQGDFSKDGDLWSAKTAIGDAQCAELVFGRDDKYRSLKVIIKNQGDYYADFSPLDSQAIIKAIALKSRFTLCGFEFSLKGTQAKLRNNKKYSSYFDDE